MLEFRFRLASKKGKTTCPKCGKKKHWQRYIHTATGEFLPIEYGRCDNEQKCGYWKKPDEKLLAEYTKNETGKTKQYKKAKKPMEKQYFDKEVCRKAANIENYEKNIFLQNLLKNVPYPFEKTKLYKVAQMYGLGTITEGHYAGAVCFPFIDIRGNVHAVQVKLFDTNNHTKDTTFLHRFLEKWYQSKNKPLPKWLAEYNTNESYVDCLFGEHLLKKPENSNKTVCIVEAPKTAIYATLYFGTENAIWLSCYNASGLTLARTKVLQGRKIALFPDLSKDGNTFAKWKATANYLQANLPNTSIKVFDLLEKLATKEQKEKGLDLADFIITQDWRAKTGTQTAENAQVPQTNTNTNTNTATVTSQTARKQYDEILEKKRKEHEYGITAFINTSEYVIIDTDVIPDRVMVTQLADFYAEYQAFTTKTGKQACDFDYFVQALKKMGYKIQNQYINLEKIPF